MGSKRRDRKKNDQSKNLADFWEKSNEDWNRSSLLQHGTNMLDRFDKIFRKKTLEEKEKDKKTKDNKETVKAFILKGIETIHRLKEAGASKEHLDGLEQLIDLYKAELKNKDSDFDWSADYVLIRFKNKVVTRGAREIFKDDFDYLKAEYPAEEEALNDLTNWEDWKPIELFLAKTTIVQIPREEPKLPELLPVPIYPPYGSDITLKDELTEAQKLRYNWDLAVARFKEVNKNVDDDTLHMWIRKQLINGWTVEDAMVPDIRQINITPVTYYWAGKPFEVWHITAYSYNDAYRTSIEQNYKGFWYWITPIEEKKGTSIQRYGAISEHNNKYFNTLKPEEQTDLFNKLLQVSGNQTLYNNALNERPLGSNFIALVKDVQSKFWPGNRKLVNGILTPDTLAKVNNQIETEAKEETESYKDDRKTLITKLYYVSGRLDLYQAAMQEQISNETPGPTAQQDGAFRNLVRSAQEVFFGPALSRSGDMDSDTYAELDKWGKLHNGNIQSMDNARVYTYVSRDYERYAFQRQSLETRIKQTRIKAENNPYWSPIHKAWQPDISLTMEAINLQTELDSYSWAGLEKKYAHLRMYSTDRQYLGSGSLMQHDITQYPLDNPFTDYKPSDVNTLSYNTFSDPYSFRPTFTPIINPDIQKERTDFYSSFSNAPQNSLIEQTNEMRMSVHLKRQELLQDPALASNSVVQLYSKVLAAYGISLNEKNATLPGTSLSTVPEPILTFYTTSSRDIQKPLIPDLPDYDIVQADTWKYDEFDKLCNAVTTKTDQLKNNPQSTDYLFFSNLSTLFSKYKGSLDLIQLKGLKGQQGGVYYASDLLDIAAELTDMEIMKKMLPQGSITADQLKNMNARRQYLNEKAIETGNASTVPAYFLMKEVPKDDKTYISSPGYRPLTQKENDLVRDGIPLNVFYKTDGYTHTLWIDVPNRGMETEVIQGFYTRDEALTELFDWIENENFFPEGKIIFTKEDKSFGEVSTRGNHWTPAEILTAIGIGLMILAIPFSGGSSGVAAYLMMGGLAVSIIAEGVGLYEKWDAGTLTGTDVAIAGLSILSMLLPGIGLLGKTAKVTGAGGRFAFLEGKTFLSTTYKVGIADGLVQGYVLTDDFITQYNNLPPGLSDIEREKAVMELLFTSLAYGLITYHSVSGDFKDLNELGSIKNHPPAINPEYKPTKFSEPFYNALKNDGFQKALPMHSLDGPNISFTYNKGPDPGPNAVAKYGPGSPQFTPTSQGVSYSTYSVTNSATGVTTKYAKRDFINQVDQGTFDKPGFTVDAPPNDLVAQKTVNAFNTRNNIEVSRPVNDLITPDHGTVTYQPPFNPSDPNAPVVHHTNGRKFTNYGGKYYEWDGIKWAECDEHLYHNAVDNQVTSNRPPSNDFQPDHNVLPPNLPPFDPTVPDAPVVHHTNGRTFTKHGGKYFEWDGFMWKECPEELYLDALNNQVNPDLVPANQTSGGADGGDNKNKGTDGDDNKKDTLTDDTKTDGADIDKNTTLEDNQGSLNTGKKTVDEILADETKIDDLDTPPDGYEFFTLNGRKYIRRISKSSDLKRLTVDERGVIVEYTGPQRISKSGKLRKNLGPAPDNHQAHHVIPDNVVRDSPLHQEAMERGLYDVDRKSNGEYMAETAEDMVEGTSDEFPIHSGSHPKYDKRCKEIIDEHKTKLEEEYGSLKDVPDDVLENTLLDIEDEMRDILKDWDNEKLD